MRIRWLAPVLVAVAIAVPVGASADEKEPHDKEPPPHASASAAASAPAGAMHMGESAESEDDDRGVAADEKPEHKEKRRSYIRHTKRLLDAAAHANHKQLTDEEREVIRRHWRWSMRLWRIRNLAEASGDKASAARVDALLAKADAKTLADLKSANDHAPAETAPPAASGGAR